MKKQVVVSLIVLIMLAVSGLGMVSAQGSTEIHAVTLDAVTLYAEPSDAAEVVVELPANTIVSVLGTDESQAWLQVSAADGEGFAPASSFVVLDPPLLAQKVQVVAEESNAALFAEQDFGSEILGTLSNGQTATILGTSGEWAYVMAPDGTTGWAVVSPFEPLPDDAQLAQVTVDSDNLGVFVEPNITADLATTLENGAVVYTFGADGEWVQVLTPDGQTGYAVAASFTPLSNVFMDAQGDQAVAAIFSEPDFAADVLGELQNGQSVYFVSSVDDFWAEIFEPTIGSGFGLKANFSNPYSIATVATGNANVRSGPNDNVYPVIATLPAGTQVIVKGKNADGSWIQVAIPFSQVQYPYRGVSGWMRDFLFVDGNGNTDLNKDVLAVVEAE